MGIRINNETVEVPGVESYWWDVPPKMQLGRDDCCPRQDSPIRAIVLHTTLGIPGRPNSPKDVLRPQKLLAGKGPRVAAKNVGTWWTTSPEHAGAHIVIDFDGSVACYADLQTTMAYHAGNVNGFTVGIEVAQQHSDAGIYEAQVTALVRLVNFLTERFGIQRQIPGKPYDGNPIKRLVDAPKSFWGVYGHRDCSASRGPGDPGDFVFDALAKAGYERFDLEAGEDLKVWQDRQIDLTADMFYSGRIDGIPGPKTCEALKRAGHPNGMWNEPTV